MVSNETSLIFSGGFDTTLAAALLSSRYKKIHLITYDNGFHCFLNHSKIHVKELKDKFGAQKYSHRIICTRELLRQIRRTIRSDILRYKSPFILDIGCKLAMYARTIIYNIEHDISSACDGTSYEQVNSRGKRTKFAKAAVDPYKSLLDEVAAFFEEYDMDFFTPVYNYGSREKRREKMVELGFTVGPKSLTKFSFTGSCPQPLCLHMVWGSPLINLNLFTLSEKEEISYFRKKKKIAKRYIDTFFEQNMCSDYAFCKSNRKCIADRRGLMNL